MLINIESPIEMIDYKLYKSKSTGNVFCTLVLNSLSEKVIKGVKIKIHCLNLFSEPSDPTDNTFDYDILFDEDVIINKPFELKEKIALGNINNIQKIKVEIIKVFFADQTIWNCNKDDLEEVEFIQIENPEMLGFVKKKIGESARFYSQEVNDKWGCVCGRLNKSNASNCMRCGQYSKDILGIYDSSELIENNMKKEEEALILIRNKEQEKKEKEKLIIRKKRKKSFFIYFSVITILLLILLSYYAIRTNFTFSNENYHMLQDIDTALIENIYDGNLNNISFLIKSGSDLNHVNIDGQTPLTAAINAGNIEILKEIVENGATINETNPSVLHLAMEKGNNDFFKYFIDQGVDIKTINENGETVPEAAIISGNVDIVKLLIDTVGFDINNIDSNGNNGLQYALYNKQLNRKLIKALLSGNIDFIKENNDGNNTYHTSILFGDPELIKDLKGFGLGMDYLDPEGNNPIHMLVSDSSKNIALMYYFIKNGVDINGLNHAGKTPLSIALENSDRKTSKFLIDNGASTNNVNVNSKSAIEIAGVNKDLIEIIEEPIKKENNASVAKLLDLNRSKVLQEFGQPNEISLYQGAEVFEYTNEFIYIDLYDKSVLEVCYYTKDKTFLNVKDGMDVSDVKSLLGNPMYEERFYTEFDGNTALEYQVEGIHYKFYYDNTDKKVRSVCLKKY